MIELELTLEYLHSPTKLVPDLLPTQQHEPSLGEHHRCCLATRGGQTTNVNPLLRCYTVHVDGSVLGLGIGRVDSAHRHEVVAEGNCRCAVERHGGKDVPPVSSQLPRKTEGEDLGLGARLALRGVSEVDPTEEVPARPNDAGGHADAGLGQGGQVMPLELRIVQHLHVVEWLLEVASPGNQQL